MEIQMLLTYALLCGFYNKVCGKGFPEIYMMLKTLNKPTLKTIKSENGDILDCVDIYKQPAFDHPALKNHKIQLKPSVEFVLKKSNSPNNGPTKQIKSQIWSKSGSCPVGTIPIRRVSRREISNASLPSQFGRKTPRIYSFLDKIHQHKTNIDLTAEWLNRRRPKNRSEAVLLAVGQNYVGTLSDINIWNPPGVQYGDRSSAQIWLLAGLSDKFESIEAGWMVDPSTFGDYRTRLFTYWTKDGYHKTGCINLLCSGFVQTSIHLALGAALHPVSLTSREQYNVRISMFLDPNSRNWWLKSQDIVLGYWPGTLFKDLKHAAIAVQWGGEVYSPNVKKKPHTKTSMGSGDWAYQLFGNSCFMTNIRIKDYSTQLKYPERLSEFSDEYNCYSTTIHRDTNTSEPYFYF